MKRTLKFPVFLCLLTGILAACETLPPPKPIPPPARAVTLDEISQSLAARQDAIHNVRSLVKTAIKTKKNNHSLKQVLLVEGDTALRLDTLSAFNQTLGVLISEGDRILLYDTDSNRLYHSAEVWDIMTRTFGTVFDFREYIGVFSGKIPRLAALTLQDVRWNSKTGAYDVSTLDPQRNEQLKIGVDPKTLLPVRLVKWKDRQLQYVVLWEDYQETPGQPPFPHVITVQRPLRGDEVIIKFKNPLINQGLPEDAFKLNLPNSN
jgi:outer membrane lipoprotein-sorting protein